MGDEGVAAFACDVREASSSGTCAGHGDGVVGLSGAEVEQQDDSSTLTDEQSEQAPYGPRPPPSLATIPAGASIQLVRALRGLYEDDSAAFKRPWLLQPVLSSAARQTPGALATPSSQPLGLPAVDPSNGQCETSPNEVVTVGESCPYVPVLDRRARAGSPPFQPWRPLSARGFPPSRYGSRPGSARPPSSARGFTSARPRSAAAASVSAKDAETAAEEEAAKQLDLLQQARTEKQEAIRSWLQRKELEIASKKRAEQQEAILQRERLVHKERLRAEQQVSLRTQRLCRLRSASRNRREHELEVRYSNIHEDSVEILGGADRVRAGLERQVVLKGALSAYGDHPCRPRPRYHAVSLRTGTVATHGAVS